MPSLWHHHRDPRYAPIPSGRYCGATSRSDPGQRRLRQPVCWNRHHHPGGAIRQYRPHKPSQRNQGRHQPMNREPWRSTQTRPLRPGNLCPFCGRSVSACDTLQTCTAYAPGDVQRGLRSSRGRCRSVRSRPALRLVFRAVTQARHRRTGAGPALGWAALRSV